MTTKTGLTSKYDHAFKYYFRDLFKSIYVSLYQDNQDSEDEVVELASKFYNEMLQNQKKKKGKLSLADGTEMKVHERLKTEIVDADKKIHIEMEFVRKYIEETIETWMLLGRTRDSPPPSPSQEHPARIERTVAEKPITKSSVESSVEKLVATSKPVQKKKPQEKLSIELSNDKIVDEIK